MSLASVKASHLLLGLQTLTVLVWGLEDITTVIQAAAVEAGIEGFRVFCPVFGCPRAPKTGRAQWCAMVLAVLRLLGSEVMAKSQTGRVVAYVGLATYLFGKTRVMPPSVAANTASRLYLGVTGRWGSRACLVLCKARASGPTPASCYT